MRAAIHCMRLRGVLLERLLWQYAHLRRQNHDDDDDDDNGDERASCSLAVLLVTCRCSAAVWRAVSHAEAGSYVFLEKLYRCFQAHLTSAIDGDMLDVMISRKRILKARCFVKTVS